MKRNSNKKRNKIIGYILILGGLIILQAPFSKRIYSRVENNKKIDKVIQIQKKDKKKDEIEEKAKKYNQSIKDSDIAMVDPFTNKDVGSVNVLDNKDDIFAYLLIPKIEVNLPLYLDASYDHIGKGVGQVSGTSIPVGGKSTRSVIAGHRGWYGQIFLLYVDKLQNGDEIYIKRGDKILTYKVYSKEIIGPYDWEKLRIKKDEDIITLLTCTPYLVNTHRLLVNAKRVEDSPKEDIETKIKTTEVNKTVKTTNYIYPIFVIIDFILILLIIIRLIKTIIK